MTSTGWRVVVREHGGPEVIDREEFDLAAPGTGEIRLRITAIGVNYIDTYHRSGLYPSTLPIGLGVEAAGVVEAIGADVEGWRTGDRVACLVEKPGTYATHLLVEADRLFALPDSISDELAAAILMKGLTAWMLIERCAKVQPGQTVLVHSAAGGVGSLLVPWLKNIDANVIAHAGSFEKARAAIRRGADHALFCPFKLLAEQVHALTDGKGADVVLDGVGAASWSASLAAIARRGMLVSYGNASGPAPAVTPLELLKAGSIFLTRPTMYHYIDTAESRAEGARRLFELVAAGALKLEAGRSFPLAEAADAHRALESRRTMGSTILTP